MTALTLYGTNTVDGTLTTAADLSNTTGGTESLGGGIGTASGTGWIEGYVRAGSVNTSAAVGSLPAPSGQGYIYQSTALEGQTMASGTWTFLLAAKCVTANTTYNSVVVRFYKYNAGTYTSISSITLTSQTINTGAKTTLTFSASLPVTAFATGDRLYIDMWFQFTGTWGANQAVQIYRAGAGGLGVVGDSELDTPGYAASSIAHKDVTVRGKISATANKDVTFRSKTSAIIHKMITFRGSTGNTAHKGISVRGRISATVFHDLSFRGKVSSTVHHSVAFRGNVIVRNVQGGFTVWANGTGTASIDHFRVTEYPDPALNLAPVLPRLGNSTVAWNEVIPTGGSRTVKTSLDGVNWTDVSSGNGGSIPGITGQPDPTIDYFDADSSANYTNTAKSGGSAATATYDTANSRISLVGGSGGLYLYNAISDNDVDLIADMDRSDAGGLVWRFVDTNNYYELGAYDDSSSSGFTNQLRLYKVVAGTRSLIGSASTVVWPRSTPGASPYKRIRVTMLGTTITVYFDGVVKQTATDNTFTSGKMGLRNDGGTSRYYQLRLQPIGDYVSGTPSGDIVTAQYVYTQVTLSTTDPTVNPQIQDLTTSASSPDIASGAVIPQLHDPSKPFAAFYNSEMDSLTQSSGDYYWTVNGNALTFANRHAVPAPWILHSSDLLFTPSVKPTFSADLYRNRQNITNCLGTVTVAGEQKIADGIATSWQMAYPLYSAPTITVQGVSKTVGVQGVDSGKDIYWQAGSASISQDSKATTIPAGSILSVNYVGQFFTTVTRNNLPEQAARKAVEGGTGIVEATEDGKQMLVSAAETYADGLLARFANNDTVEIQVVTERSGLQKGQVVPTFIPEHSIMDAQLLITKVVTTGEQLADGTVLYQWQVTATNGPSLARWSTALGL